MDTVEQIFGAALDAVRNGNGMSAASGETVSEASPRPAAIVPTTFPMCRLAAFVMETWHIAVDHRRTSGVDAKLRYALLSQTCQYSDAQKAADVQSAYQKAQQELQTLYEQWEAAEAALSEEDA